MPSLAPTKSAHLHPIFWMPSLYFAMGVPMITVSVVAAIMYKNLGLSNTEVALYTGSLYLPWVAKALWSPLIDLFKTKKFFVVGTQLSIAVGLGGVALALPLPGYLPITLALFWVIGFLSATHDIAGDGVYINAMSATEQARYVGLQGMCWNAGRIFASGLLVSFTGYLHSAEHGLGYSWTKSWVVVMSLLALIMLVMGLWHRFALPAGSAEISSEGAVGLKEMGSSFVAVFTSYFQKKGIVRMLCFVLFYRVGEGFLDKIGPLFLLDKREAGGLGLDNFAVGNINGTFGSVAFISGALIGGWVAARFGLKRMVVWFCLMLNVPHLTFVYLSYAMPTDVTWIATVVVIEKLGYGIGSIALMLYMMQQVAPGNYRTAHYAISTGFMASCMMVTGMLSGVLQSKVGYPCFFLLVMAAMIPSLLVSWLSPFNIEVGKPDAASAGGAH